MIVVQFFNACMWIYVYYKPYMYKILLTVVGKRDSLNTWTTK